MSRIERLFLILNLIRSGRNLNAKELARECKVSERTIYRDIKAMRSANISIDYDKGCKFLSDTFLPPMNLSLDEYITIYLGLNSGVINEKPVLKLAGKRALAKLEAIMPENVRKEYLEIRKEMDDPLRFEGQDSEKIRAFGFQEGSLLKE